MFTFLDDRHFPGAIDCNPELVFPIVNGQFEACHFGVRTVLFFYVHH